MSVALDPAARFWPKVDKSGECWLWTASLTADGYGQFRSGGKGSKMVKAHTFACTQLVGPVPEGRQLDHLCRTRRCVNPAHLEPVTGRENLMRGGTLAAENAAKTHCPRNHPLSGDNVYVDKRGSRSCRQCRNDQKNEWRAQNLEVVRRRDREAARRKRKRNRTAGN